MQQISNNMLSFYKLYESLFGVKNCTYTVHVVATHLSEMRIDGPLTETSAFDYENFYAELRRSFAPGTPNPLKQIFQTVLLKRVLRAHSCNPPVYFSPKDTPLESNSIIYVFQDSKHEFYKIKEVLDSGNFMCVKIGKYPVSFNDSLPGNSVGVYGKGPITSKQTLIPRKKCSGKAIIVKNLLITCPSNILEEK